MEKLFFSFMGATAVALAVSTVLSVIYISYETVGALITALFTSAFLVTWYAVHKKMNSDGRR